MKEIEHILDGNICRCTGYRPIHDAFKSFASDASESLLKTISDIEGKSESTPSFQKLVFLSNILLELLVSQILQFQYDMALKNFNLCRKGSLWELKSLKHNN